MRPIRTKRYQRTGWENEERSLQWIDGTEKHAHAADVEENERITAVHLTAPDQSSGEATNGD
jgi:hypothetical protein